MGTKNNDQKIKDVCNVFTMYKLTGGGLRKIEPAGMLPLYSRVYAFAPGMDKTQYAVIDDKNNLVKMSKNYDGDYFGPFKKFETHNEPVSKKFGIGFYWDDLEPDFRFDATAVEKAIKAGHDFEKQMAENERAKAIDDAEQREQIKKDFAHLIINEKNDDRITKANLIADLKLNFPGVKFSVRKEDYSCYYIRWTDGPSDEDVSKIVDKYQDHHSDQLTGDYWDYDPSNFNRVFGGFKYVMTSRDFSEKITALYQTYKEQFTGRDKCPEQIIGRIIRAATIPAKFDTVKIEPTGINCGGFTEFYKLSFDQPTEPEPTTPDPTTHEPAPKNKKDIVTAFYNDLTNATAKKIFFDRTDQLTAARFVFDRENDPANDCGLSDLVKKCFKYHQSKNNTITTVFLKHPRNGAEIPENNKTEPPKTNGPTEPPENNKKTETKQPPAQKTTLPGMVKNAASAVARYIECKSNFTELNVTMPLIGDGVKLLKQLKKRYQLLLKDNSYPDNHFLTVNII
jgi:hypothetical protein